MGLSVNNKQKVRLIKISMGEGGGGGGGWPDIFAEMA